MSVYATKADLRSMIGSTKTTRDDVLQDVLDATEIEVNAECGRQFQAYTDYGTGASFAADATERFFFPDKSTWSWVDDYVHEAGVEVSKRSSLTGDWTLLTKDTDYQILPLNSLKNNQAWPVERVELLTGSFASGKFPTLKIKARWGWPAVPSAVKRATLLQASKLFDREDSPAGTLGFDGFGAVVRVQQGLDRDAQTLLAGYRRLVIV